MSVGCTIKELSPGLAGSHDHWRNNQHVVDSLSAVNANDELVFLLEMPRQPATGAGNGLVLPVRGICIHRHVPVRSLKVTLGAHQSRLRCREPRDEVAHRLSELGFANAKTSGFSGTLKIDANDNESLFNEKPVFELNLHDGQRLRHVGSQAIFVPHSDMEADPVVQAVRLQITPQWCDDQGARVFIGMATYNPQPEAFARQLQSIRAQTHSNWHLLINDDCSDAAAVVHMQNCAATDDRITFVKNSINQGFYHNFESLLQQAPASAQYIALSDQDDFWYPEKLERLLGAMRSDVTLSYCDMRVRSVDGAVLSDTYWRGRRNNFQDLDVLLLANTVTGAASLFRYNLLQTLLPFPPRIGDAFHDHWIACAALAQGNLSYIDEPLYDYIQHEEAVVGHCDFETPSVQARLIRLGETFFRHKGKGSVRCKLMHARQSALAVFRFECRRIELICSNLLIRCPQMTEDKARALQLYGNGSSSGIRLLLKHLSVIRRGHSTNDAEIRLGTGYLIDALDYSRHRLVQRLRAFRRALPDNKNTIGSAQ